MHKILIALGGNALQGDLVQQYENARKMSEEIVGLMKQYSDLKIVLTHGNGPQVGNIVLRSELASEDVYPLPLDVCVSDSEGGMGYMLQQVLHNILIRNGYYNKTVSLVTQTLVLPDDPAFNNPTKPIGQFYSEEKAKALIQDRKWNMKEDSGRGFRRVVPSPQPIDIIEMEAVRTLMESGFFVIASGGGGIPVVKDPDGCLHGVEAVVDKDLASCLIAKELLVKTFVILTAVDQVYVYFNTPQQKPISNISVSELSDMYEQGLFPVGSMGPKVKAMVQFIQACPESRGIITSPALLTEALKGNAGTHVLKG